MVQVTEMSGCRCSKQWGSIPLPMETRSWDTPKGLKCRECGRRYAAVAVHVCEFCFGPLEVDDRYHVLKSLVRRA